jgi:hypothetical protein
MTLTETLGVLGFIVALAMALLRAFEFLRDRAHLRLSIGLPLPVLRPGQPAPEPSVVLHALCARRPMTVTDMGLSFREGFAQSAHLSGGHLPQALSENQQLASGCRSPAFANSPHVDPRSACPTICMLQLRIAHFDDG